MSRSSLLEAGTKSEGLTGQMVECSFKNKVVLGSSPVAGNDQFMFVLTILEKIKETRLKFSQRSVTVL